jgi:hypothetical protein
MCHAAITRDRFIAMTTALKILPISLLAAWAAVVVWRGFDTPPSGSVRPRHETKTRKRWFRRN